MSHGAQIEDKVTIQFNNGEQINGTVKHIPTESGDSWIIWGEDGTIAHVQHYETITVLNRYAEGDASPVSGYTEYGLI